MCVTSAGTVSARLIEAIHSRLGGWQACTPEQGLGLNSTYMRRCSLRCKGQGANGGQRYRYSSVLRLQAQRSGRLQKKEKTRWPIQFPGLIQFSFIDTASVTSRMVSRRFEHAPLNEAAPPCSAAMGGLELACCENPPLGRKNKCLSKGVNSKRGANLPRFQMKTNIHALVTDSHHQMPKCFSFKSSN